MKKLPEGSFYSPLKVLAFKTIILSILGLSTLPFLSIVVQYIDSVTGFASGGRLMHKIITRLIIISSAALLLSACARKEGCVTVNRDDENSETTMDYREYKTGVEIFGVTPEQISSIKVVINSGTAKGKEYALSKENEAVTYQKIMDMFFGEDIKYALIKTSYDSDDYALKVCFYEQNRQLNVFIYDGDTIKTDQSDGFYIISQEIDNTIFRNLVQQNQ